MLLGPVLLVHVRAELCGGAEKSLLELAGALLRRGVELKVALPESGGGLAEALAKNGIEVIGAALPLLRRPRHLGELFSGWRNWRRSRREMGRLAAGVRARIVHGNNVSAALSATDVAPASLVWHARDLVPMGPVGALLRRKTRAVIAISRAVRDHLLAQGFAEDQIKLVPHGIDLAPYLPDADWPTLRQHRRRARRELLARLGWPEEVSLSLVVSSLAPWKRVGLALAAFRRLRRQVEGARLLLLVWDPDHRERPPKAAMPLSCPNTAALRSRLALANGEENGVALLGWQEEVSPLMFAADILVSPSANEPFGRVLVEAMAAGCGVLSTAGGGKKEIVSDGVTGRLVADEATPEKLAEVWEELLGNAGQRQRLARAGRERTLRDFSVARTAEGVIEVYRQVLAEEA